ncbi:MAG: hypothetical protein NTV46_08105, partial [Verrucomicrobia bacterium]|nr:hypothetical protein [Verrucomicrobiota bacterium]
MNTMAGQTTGLELMEAASPEALMPDSGLWLWLVIAAMVVLVVIVIMIYLRNRKPAAADLERIRHAALAEATAALANIRTADVRDAAVQSSLILRRYVLAVTGDPALYETHEEFVVRPDALQALTAEARAAAETGFTRMAAMKYAPEMPAA